MKKVWEKDMLMLGVPYLIISSFISYFIIQYLQSGQDFVAVGFVVLNSLSVVVINVCIHFIIGLLIWSISGEVRIASVLLILFSGLIGYVSHMKNMLRGEPLYPSDFNMIGDISSILSYVDLQSILNIFGMIAVSGVLIYFVRATVQKRLKLFSRVALYVSSGVLLFNFVGVLRENFGGWSAPDQYANYVVNGVALGFIYNLGSQPMADDASATNDALQELYDVYYERALEINEGRENDTIDSNVLYIMNESFMDPLLLPSSDRAIDPLAKTREISKNTLSGTMLSQGYGGGTGNIEFEAITGVSIEPFLPGISTPYTQLSKDMSRIPSFVDRMYLMGHATTAVHSYTPSMYKRVANYERLGFEQFYYDETMQYTDSKNGYISDRASYREVMLRMDGTDDLDFIHLVTMQNHMPYIGKYKNPVDSGYDSEDIDNYYQDLLYSDKAYADFHEDLINRDESTTVVFFGDHWPSVFDDYLDELDNNVEYMTPVMIYDVHDDSSRGDIGMISPIYFMIEVLKMHDVKVSPYEAFLMSLQEELPAFEKGMYYEKGSRISVTSRDDLSLETKDLLLRYDNILHDAMMGSHRLADLGFYDLAE